MCLGGYAIECKIKAKAMERHRCGSLGELQASLGLDDCEVFSHKLDTLLLDLLPSGIQGRLMQGPAGAAFRSQVNQWSHTWRYDPKNPPPERARAFLDAIDEVWAWLEHNA